MRSVSEKSFSIIGCITCIFICACLCMFVHDSPHLHHILLLKLAIGTIFLPLMLMVLLRAKLNANEKIGIDCGAAHLASFTRILWQNAPTSDMTLSRIQLLRRKPRCSPSWNSALRERCLFNISRNVYCCPLFFSCYLRGDRKKNAFGC
jgi:hypothetical protein